jgi:uncharacterized protein DUF5985
MDHAEFVAGAIATLFGVCALFFLRFWMRTREMLFAAFALTFLLLAIGYASTVLLNLEEEERTWIYVTRLVAFLILAAAIVRKNFDR